MKLSRSWHWDEIVLCLSPQLLMATDELFSTCFSTESARTAALTNATACVHSDVSPQLHCQPRFNSLIGGSAGRGKVQKIFCLRDMRDWCDWVLLKECELCVVTEQWPLLWMEGTELSFHAGFPTPSLLPQDSNPDILLPIQQPFLLQVDQSLSILQDVRDYSPHDPGYVFFLSTAVFSLHRRATPPSIKFQ